MTSSSEKEVHVIIRRQFPDGMTMQQVIVLNELIWFESIGPVEHVENAIDRMFEQEEPPK